MITIEAINEFRKELIKQTRNTAGDTEAFLSLHDSHPGKVLPFVQKKIAAAYNNAAPFVAPTDDEAA
jgi:hypothetical protein